MDVSWVIPSDYFRNWSTIRFYGMHIYQEMMVQLSVPHPEQ